MHSLRRRITLILLSILAPLLVGGILAVYLAVRVALQNQFDEALRVKVLTIITGTVQENEKFYVWFSDRFLREFAAEVATDFFQLWDDGHNTIKRSDSLHDGDLEMVSGTLDKPFYRDTLLPSGARGRLVGIRFTPRVGKNQKEDAVVHQATIVVASSRAELDRSLGAVKVVLLFSSVIWLGGIAMVVPVALKRGFIPLALLGEHVSKLDADTLTNRFPDAGLPVELKPITGKLNELLGRLDASFERERRFSSDIAHELRTPIAELKSMAEVAIKWPDSCGGDLHKEYFLIAIQMESLVSRLLELGRAEQGRVGLEVQPLPVDQTVKRILASGHTGVISRGLKVNYSNPSPDCIIQTDTVFWKAIVGNLISNAIQYAPEMSLIDLSFVKSNSDYKLSVANDAPELTTEDLPKLFERFWRKDDSRTQSERSGLGLSLAYTFSRLLGCRLTAALSEEKRLVITLEGPLAVSDQHQASS